MIYDYLSTHADDDKYRYAMVGYLLDTASGEYAGIHEYVGIYQKYPGRAESGISTLYGKGGKRESAEM